MEHGLVEHLSQHRVHLAWHDGRTRLDGRKTDLAQAGPRPHRQEAEIAGDLSALDGETAHGTRDGEHIPHALRYSEPIRRGHQRPSRVPRERSHGARGVVVAGVEARAHRSGPEVQLEQLR